MLGPLVQLYAPESASQGPPTTAASSGGNRGSRDGMLVAVDEHLEQVEHLVHQLIKLWIV